MTVTGYRLLRISGKCGVTQISCLFTVSPFIRFSIQKRNTQYDIRNTFLGRFTVKPSSRPTTQYLPRRAVAGTAGEIRATSDEIRLSAKRAGMLDQIPKKIKKFSPFLTPYFTTSYALRYPLYAICYTLFFVPNAQLHPIVERRCFSAPVLFRSVRSFVLNI